MTTLRRSEAWPVTVRRIRQRSGPTSPSVATLTDSGCYPQGGLLDVLVLPYADDAPPVLSKATVGVSVSLDVHRDLLGPEGRIHGRGCVMSRTAVPETAVEEHRDPLTGEDQICGPGEGLDRPSVDPVAEPKLVDSRTKAQLRSRIPMPVGLHRSPGASRTCPRVRFGCLGPVYRRGLLAPVMPAHRCVAEIESTLPPGYRGFPRRRRRGRRTGSTAPCTVPACGAPKLRWPRRSADDAPISDHTGARVALIASRPDAAKRGRRRDLDGADSVAIGSRPWHGEGSRGAWSRWR